jgi:alpha-amylase
VDHVYPLDVTIEDLVACRDVERGDFATGSYISEAQRTAEWVALSMSRPGRADGCLIHVKKTIRLAAGRPALEVHYELEDLPADRSIHFAVELNLAGMAGHADDRYFADSRGNRLGLLDARLDLPEQDGLNLSDGWLDLSVGLSWSRPAGVWCFPIETVSQSEGGFEGVYQSSAVIPHWLVGGDGERHWDVTIVWSLGRAQVEAPSQPPTRRTGAVHVEA